MAQVMPIAPAEFNARIENIEDIENIGNIGNASLSPEHYEVLYQMYIRLLNNNAFQEFLGAIDLAEETIPRPLRFYRIFAADPRRTTWNWLTALLYDVVSDIHQIQYVVANHRQNNFAYNGQTLGDFIERL